jgi:5-hydroxyisourate hydrolase
MRIDLYRLDGDERRELARVVTNDDGRTDEPLLAAGGLTEGSYELVFHVGPYFASHLPVGAGPPFLDRVPIRFGVADAAAGYHVPLLVAPYAYSTYRGS